MSAAFTKEKRPRRLAFPGSEKHRPGTGFAGRTGPICGFSGYGHPIEVYPQLPASACPGSGRRVGLLPDPCFHRFQGNEPTMPTDTLPGCDYLHGGGVASLEKAGREMSLQPLHGALRELCGADSFEPGNWRFFMAAREAKKRAPFGRNWKKKYPICFFLPAERPGRCRDRKSRSAPRRPAGPATILRTAKGRTSKVAVGARQPDNSCKSISGKNRNRNGYSFWRFMCGDWWKRAAKSRSPDCRVLFRRMDAGGSSGEILRSWGFFGKRPQSGPANDPDRLRSGNDDPRLQPGPGPGGGGCGSGTGKLVRTMTRMKTCRPCCNCIASRKNGFFNREAFNGFCAWLTILIMWELNRDWQKSERGGEASHRRHVERYEFPAGPRPRKPKQSWRAFLKKLVLFDRGINKLPFLRLNQKNLTAELPFRRDLFRSKSCIPGK